MLLVAMFAVESETMYLLWLTRECPGNVLPAPTVSFHPGTINVRISKLPWHVCARACLQTDAKEDRAFKYGIMVGSVHCHCDTIILARTAFALTTATIASTSAGHYTGAPAAQMPMDPGTKSMTAIAMSVVLCLMVETKATSSDVLLARELPPHNASGEHDTNTDDAL